MEYIKCNGKNYPIRAIHRINSNVIEVEYEEEIPEAATAQIEMFTSGGVSCGTLSGYETIYQELGNCIKYSNDKSVYVETVSDPDAESEPVLPELTDEEKALIEKQNEIKELEDKISEIDNRFHQLDYIGIKIATGRAKISDYELEIDEMQKLADEKNELENQLNTMREELENGKL